MPETVPETSVTKKDTAPAPAPSAPPANIWDSFRTEMNDLFDRFGGFSFLPTRKTPGWIFQAPFGLSLPVCDFVEDEKGFKITAELPGLTEKEVDLSLAGDVLTIKGEKKEEKEEKTRNSYVSERSYGSFQRSFQLPRTADLAKIDAAFAKGVLTITLPKRPEAATETKKVEIKAAH
jgi:HSP20 family protein